MTTGISKRISSIQFALLSPDEIRKMSQIKVITADTYDDDGYPIERGLMDLHMGVIEPGLKCATCFGKVDECPGHFGHIELAMPVVHVGFIKEIKTFLESTCSSCGRIKLTQDQIDKYRKRMEGFDFASSDPENLALVSKRITDEATMRKICPHCNAPQKAVILDKPTTFREEGIKVTPKEIRERLERIPDSDLIFFGMNSKVARPEWMVLTVLPVPPINVRPSITLETGTDLSQGGYDLGSTGCSPALHSCTSRTSP